MVNIFPQTQLPIYSTEQFLLCQIFKSAHARSTVTFTAQTVHYKETGFSRQHVMTSKEGSDTVERLILL